MTILLSRFHLTQESHGQMDRQIDRFAISISRVSALTRDKKQLSITFFSTKLTNKVRHEEFFAA